MKTCRSVMILFTLLVVRDHCVARSDGVQDTNSVIALNKKGWEVRNSDLEQAKQYAIKAIHTANTINYSRGLSYSFNILGHYFKVKSQYDSAAYYYKKSLMIRNQLRDTLNMARSYRNLTDIEKLRGNNERAIKTGLFAIKLLNSQIQNDEVVREKAWMYVNLVPIYLRKGNYLKAVSSATEGKHLFGLQQNEEGMAAASNNLGYVYEFQKRYDKALIEYNFAVKSYINTDNQHELAKGYQNIANIYYVLGHFKEALSHYLKAYSIQKEEGFEDDIQGILYNMGIIYESIGKNDSAFLFYNQSLGLAERSGNTESRYETQRAIGNLLFLQGKHKDAINHLQQALILSANSGAVSMQFLVLKDLADAYKSIGQKDSALKYTERHTVLNDSLNNILRNSIVLESSLKERESDLSLITETNKRQRFIIISISTILGLVLIIFFVSLIAARTKKRELVLKQIINEKELIIKEKELMVLDAMMEGQDEERKRLATELHDTIGSMLVATKYAFNALDLSMEKFREDSKEQYHKIDKMLDDAMDSVRRISHDMAEVILTEKGLEGALLELCETFGKTGKIKFNLDLYGFSQRMEYRIEFNLYRIVQQLMTNIVNHAHANNVQIQLLKSKDNINLIVEDDGKGFDPEDPNLRKGIGISNIAARVEKLSGKLNIDSGKGKGTTVIIDVPVHEMLS